MALAAVGQFCATSFVEANTKICCGLIKKAAERGAKMLFLPEASDFIAESKEQALSLASNHVFIQGVQQAAKDANIWVSVGFHEQCHEDTQRLFNTQIVMNDNGSVVAHYRKIHLFDVDIKNGPRLMESESTIAGDSLVPPVKTPLGQVGLQICYDVRFSELSIAQRRLGADVLTFPSAFTVKTGMAHWETLLRARAIETQCYVMAAAQIGQHNPKRASYGHAMIVDPWGTVLGQCADTQEGLAFGVVDLDYLGRIRQEMPVMTHRRPDQYQ
ncbi:carbon-nitrogen hydrolase [Hesseltinella vesiculosa]|uniref:Carbon-nitrogen hydrolase n=1 Tax=Hesseltinella vesiculosa TaxID=101127 RepID=A0A1X2GFD0_9FUNG|nr:carbon-nitrogen hydrolase [Hesseltinella vesiculosa]